MDPKEEMEVTNDLGGLMKRYKLQKSQGAKAKT